MRLTGVAQIAPPVYYPARNKNWPELILELSLQPQAAQYRDSRGFTSLHEACVHDPPLEVVVSLVNAFPEAASITNMWGDTPLHIACLSSSPEVVKYLLYSDISIVSVKNKGNHTPLENLCEFYEYDIKEVTDSSTLSQQKELSNIWNNACLLVKAKHLGSVEVTPLKEEKWRMLHSCVAITDCPVVLTELAIKIHPEQLRETDEDGNNPLHLAITAKIERERANAGSSIQPEREERKCAQYDDNVEDQADGKETIDLLLLASPSAARGRNRRGKLPLHLAIQGGELCARAVKPILESYPAALACEGIDERFFPTILSHLGRDFSFSTLFDFLREVIAETIPDNVIKEKKRKRIDVA